MRVAAYLRKLVVILPLLLGCLLFFRSLFFEPNNDWDLDAFLYIGSRLWEGELLYSRDFETKLPMVQYLFAGAFALGGIGAWRIITFVTIVLLGLPASRLIAEVAQERGPFPLNRSDLSLLMLGLVLTLLYSLPFAMSAHLGMIAAAAAYMSLALLMAEGKGRMPLLLLFLSGLALAFAALVRPNYVYVLPVCLAYLALEWRNRSFSAWGVRPAAFLSGFAALIAVSFLPYALVPQGIDILLDGLRAIASFSPGTPAGQLLASQFNSQLLSALWFNAVLYAACMAAVILMLVHPAVRQGRLWVHAAVSIACVAALNVSLLNTHYWPHNTMMFVPYLIPVLAFLWQAANTLLATPRRIAIVSTAAGAGLCLAILPLIGAQVAGMVRNPERFDSAINQRKINPALLRYLADVKQSGRSFLFVDAPIYHAILGESRVGDGHPSILSWILSGNHIRPIAGIPLFSAEGQKEPCKVLVSARKDVIILNKQSGLSRQVFDCVQDPSAGYRIARETRSFIVLERPAD